MKSVVPPAAVAPSPNTRQCGGNNAAPVNTQRRGTVQLVKMGKTGNRVNGSFSTAVPHQPVPVIVSSEEDDQMSADITEELRAVNSTLGRDVIAISTTATPVQVSMSPQEEMQTHVHLEKALKASHDKARGQGNHVIIIPNI